MSRAPRFSQKHNETASLWQVLQDTPVFQDARERTQAPDPLVKGSQFYTRPQNKSNMDAHGIVSHEQLQVYGVHHPDKPLGWINTRSTELRFVREETITPLL